MDSVAWAAGLFEGEGCISQVRSRGYNASGLTGRVYVYPHLSLAMTDEDVVRRFANVMGVGNVKTQPQRRRGRVFKTMYRWDVAGSTARPVIARLLPHLGWRRRVRAIEVFELDDLEKAS